MPHDVGELQAEIPWTQVTPVLDLSRAGAEIRITVRDRDLALGCLALHPGEHLLVLGPARSGRTTALHTLVRAAGGYALVVGDGELARRSGVCPTEPTALRHALAERDVALVVIDDMLEVVDHDGYLSELVEGARAGVHVVGSARPDRYRSAYGHWAADMKSSRAGLLLRPEPMDGDLLGRQLPARLNLRAIPGRALAVCDGEMEVVQVVLPGRQSSSS